MLPVSLFNSFELNDYSTKEKIVFKRLFKKTFWAVIYLLFFLPAEWASGSQIPSKMGENNIIYHNITIFLILLLKYLVIFTPK